MSCSEFESELQAFDRDSAPQDAVVFYGSSSFRLWENIAEAFPGVPVVNRGFGGSTLAECLDLIPRLIVPLRPSALILYAGDNDLDLGASPERVETLFHQFIQRIRETLPHFPIAFLSIKPSPSRYWNIANIRRANTLIQAAAAKYSDVGFLDVFPAMLSPSGASRPDLFTEDGLHMNPAGYALWTKAIAAWLESLQTPATQTTCT